MTLSRYASIAAIASLVLVTGCANTIRGAGQDTANTVNATQHAGKKIANSTN
ncbi:MAG TPA: entericidin [Mesorhizobium sp.]|jgi:entericidin B